MNPKLPTRRTFLSPFESMGVSLLTKDFDGEECEVHGVEMLEEWDTPEALYSIRFDDGTEAQAFGEELGFTGALVDGKLWPHPNLSDAEIDADEPFRTWEEWAELTRNGEI